MTYTRVTGTSNFQIESAAINKHQDRMSATQPQYQYYNEDDVPSPFGLQNTGAICWFNALMQMCLGLPSLNSTMVESADDLHDNPFAAEYVKLVKECLGLGERRDAFDPAASSSLILQHMLTRLRKEKPRIAMGTGQECADEGLTMFVEMLDCPKVNQLFNNVYELQITCDQCNQVVSTQRDGAIRIQMFTRMPLDTQEEFCKFIRTHLSEVDSFKCDNCGHLMRKFLRVEKLKRLREVIIIIFNKYNEKDIRWFPTTLSFKAVQGGTLDYKLVGKVDHSGTRHSGHYWANSLRNGQWFTLNDMSVTPGTCAPEASTVMIAYHLVK
jgi:ubiquitin C-terminal hydrolase